MAVRADLDQVAAEFLAWDHEEGDIGEGQEEGLRGRVCGGDDGAVRDLVDDLGA